MDTKAYNGTITSKLKPIVTMLTESLVKDFAPAYRRMQHFPAGSDESLWLRTDEDGGQTVVTDQQLWQDVYDWLMNLEDEMASESDREFAKICVHMIRKNKGWVTLLTNRVRKRIA